MRLSDLSIRNPVFAVMLSAAMVVFGYLGYRDMGVSQFPEIDFPVVSIVITREAASPEIMDGDVTDVVEDAVAGVEGVDYIMSQSLEASSSTPSCPPGTSRATASSSTCGRWARPTASPSSRRYS